MTSAEVRAIIEAKLDGDLSTTNGHGVDLRKCLVEPRRVACRNTFPKLQEGKPLQLWIVLEETLGKSDGYLVVFDEERAKFGLADWDGEFPVFLGFHGTFLDSLRGM
jgi:hypothetical protein